MLPAFPAPLLPLDEDGVAGVEVGRPIVGSTTVVVGSTTVVVGSTTALWKGYKKKVLKSEPAVQIVWPPK